MRKFSTKIIVTLAIVAVPRALRATEHLDSQRIIELVSNNHKEVRKAKLNSKIAELHTATCKSVGRVCADQFIGRGSAR